MRSTASNHGFELSSLSFGATAKADCPELVVYDSHATLVLLRAESSCGSI